MKRLNCIMLIDDNRDDNFFHERVIKKINAAEMVIPMRSAKEALDYLISGNDNTSSHPDLIFLDINMPGMSGWEFLHQYDTLAKRLQRRPIVILLTTSENPDDQLKAYGINIVSDFRTKPLTIEMLEEVINKYF